ncbi:MAG TPA: outer membrane lipoprotein carrier protein LolA, partial [Caulobacteraceae bacterium]|nr:outer membrane lipoprotein carrier protein LolA [Caulobacteraceae bacterium]
MTVPLTRRTALFALAASAIAAPVLAASTPSPTLSEQDAALVGRAVAYLEGLPASKGRFVQTDPRGAVARG